MSNKPDYGFEIGQQVMLIEAGKRGKIVSVMQNAQGIQYEVRLWDDTIRYLVWVFADEIKSIHVEKRVIA